VLRHEVAILWPDGKRELRAINLVEYGEIDGHSAMAKAVGFPAAIASKMILDGECLGHFIYMYMFLETVTKRLPSGSIRLSLYN
jgi:saccharopine dehydrogenase-like NADP-dependent oxidoreductase